MTKVIFNRDNHKHFVDFQRVDYSFLEYAIVDLKKAGPLCLYLTLRLHSRNSSGWIKTTNQILNLFSSRSKSTVYRWIKEAEDLDWIRRYPGGVILVRSLSKLVRENKLRKSCRLPFRGSPSSPVKLKTAFVQASNSLALRRRVVLLDIQSRKGYIKARETEKGLRFTRRYKLGLMPSDYQKRREIGFGEMSLDYSSMISGISRSTTYRLKRINIKTEQERYYPSWNRDIDDLKISTREELNILLEQNIIPPGGYFWSVPKQMFRRRGPDLLESPVFKRGYINFF